MSGIEDDPGPCVCADCQNAREQGEAEKRFLGLCPYCYSPMNGPCGHCIAEANAAGTTYEVKRLKAEAEDQRAAYGFLEVEVAEQIAKVAERDAMIATDDIELQAKDATIAERDASIAQLATRLAADDQDATIERVRALCSDAEDRRDWIPVFKIRAALDAPTEPAGAPCPDSCGGQSWTGVNTNYGRRWRCDTCGRVISRYVTDAIQAADDRRSL